MFEVDILEQDLILCTFNFIIMKCNMYVMFLAFFKNNNIIRSNIKKHFVHHY